MIAYLEGWLLFVRITEVMQKTLAHYEGFR